MRGDGARDGNMAVFQRLAQNLKRLPREFREFIEKKNAAVSERDFAGRRTRSAAEQPDCAYSMMRSAKWTVRHKTARAFRRTGD